MLVTSRCIFGLISRSLHCHYNFCCSDKQWSIKWPVKLPYIGSKHTVIVLLVFHYLHGVFPPLVAGMESFHEG